MISPKANRCKYLGIVFSQRFKLGWKRAWKALHFTMRILKKGNSITKSLA
jgi:hypothetical protein